MRIFLSGWSGFIGRNLLEFPKFQEHELVCWIRPGADPGKVPNRQNIFAVKGEISPRLFEGVDAVINMAGRAHRMKDRSSDWLVENRTVNRDLPLEIAKSAVEAGVQKFIHLSTVKVMGEREIGPGGIFRENDPPKPEDSYGISKLEVEKGLLALFSMKEGKCCTILRLPMVYGPGNKGNMMLLLKAAAAAIPLPLACTTGKRSMLYVGNLCDALHSTATNVVVFGVDSYFISDGEDKTSAELYSLISFAYMKKRMLLPFPVFLVRYVALFGDILSKFTRLNVPINSLVIGRLFDSYRFSSEKFMKTFNWAPPFSLKEGIVETVKWHKGLTKGGNGNNQVTEFV